MYEHLPFIAAAFASTAVIAIGLIMWRRQNSGHRSRAHAPAAHSPAAHRKDSPIPGDGFIWR